MIIGESCLKNSGLHKTPIEMSYRVVLTNRLAKISLNKNPLQISMTSKNYLLLLDSKPVSKVKFSFLNTYFVPGKVSAFKRIHFKKGKWNLRKQNFLCIPSNQKDRESFVLRTMFPNEEISL